MSRQWRALRGVVLLCLLLAVTHAGAAGMTMPGSGSGESSESGGGSERAEEVSPEQMSAALDQLIVTLESSEQRGALLESLRQLRDASQARAESGTPEAPSQPQGLLGALTETFEEMAGQQGEGRGLVERWQIGALRAGQDVVTLRAGGWFLLRDFVLTGAALLVLGGVFYSLIHAAGRRYGVTLELPEQPGVVALARYCLRRILPTGLAFALVLGVVFQLGATPGMLLATTLGWAALCGMIFASVCEVVFSVFSWGHRRTALRLLRQQGARPLFYIGAAAALGDALNTTLMRESLGAGSAGFVAGLANLLAVLLAGIFVLRFKRPIRHLIRNRPWSRRRRSGAISELIRVLGGLWHVPALLLVAVSLAGVVSHSGDVRSILGRAMLTAALMVVVLIVSGLLRRSTRQVRTRPHRSLYTRRLVRFGHVLLHLFCWAVFAQLAALIWGVSLLPAEEGDAYDRIAQPLVSIGLTLLISWLVWILIDTAIYRAMTSTSRSQRGRARRARAETITPLLRNVVFVTIVVIASIAALANLGVNVTPLLAGAGVIGLAVGFGAQTLVQDLITGVFILVEDTLAIDDFVDVGGNMGTVEKLSLRTIRLRDLDGIVHSVPFSQIKAVQNYSREFGYALFRIRIPWNMTIDYAQQMIEELAEEMRNDPLFRFRIWSALEMQGIESFTEGAAIVRARFRTAPLMQWDVVREFNLRLKRRMDQEGFDLAAPRMSLRIEKEAAQTLVSGENGDHVETGDNDETGDSNEKGDGRTTRGDT